MTTGQHRTNYPVRSGTHPVSSSVLKKLINNWDFSKPDWSSLPSGFPNSNKKSLSTKEMLLFDGIKLAWTASENGRRYFYKMLAKRSLAAIAAVAIIWAGKSLVANEPVYTKTVHAATIKVDDVVQSTMSAILRK